MRPDDRNPEPIISPDGRHVWDGQQWQPRPITSPDGNYVWNGHQWQPREPAVAGTPESTPEGHTARNLWIGFVGLIVLVIIIGVATTGNKNTTSGSGPLLDETTANPTPPPAPSPTPQFAADPTVNVVPHQAQHSFTISATNTSPVVCHNLELRVLGESGTDPQPQSHLNYGISDGKLYPFHDVAPGQTVSTTLDAYAILKMLPRDQSFAVGATGFCQDSRSR